LKRINSHQNEELTNALVELHSRYSANIIVWVIFVIVVMDQRDHCSSTLNWNIRSCISVKMDNFELVLVMLIMLKFVFLV